MPLPLKYRVGQTLTPDELIRELIQVGYERADRVFESGQFAARGEIVDIFPFHFDSPVRIGFDHDTLRLIASFNIRSSTIIARHSVVILFPRRKTTTSFDAATPLNPFVDIQPGDYVVHHVHGIGRFLGHQPLDLPEGPKNHLVIEYQGGDRLYIPEHDLHLVQKYMAFQKRPSKLHKLGSREWQRIKARAQKKCARTAAELLRLQAIRSALKGFAFSKDTAWQKEFESDFPYPETPDQIRVTQEVKRDMESSCPMDRLICGDVGFGKTEIAMRAAFKAVMDGKQAAVLVPTTVLAEQHGVNFTQRMKKFPIRIGMLSRFLTPAKQQKLLQGLARGEIDIVIGTHRLLSPDVVFKDLGLIIVDEEQRFGVKAKEQLKHRKLLVDVLTLTATPIPRTLYMALSGARDMSVISTPPQNRVPVITHIIEFDKEILRLAMQRELRRKGQVFFLHNRVEDIEKMAKIIQQLMPDARCAIAHGQLPAKELETVMLAFLTGEIDILVCTTIIESGIDVPNANTLILNRADRFGLAELHQLRGRVGRFSHQAYAYFVVPPTVALSKVAKDRLKAIERHSELGAGFQVAYQDLQIRGSGNLLGREQSGTIAAIGFDLYCRLLKESIEHLKRDLEGNDVFVGGEKSMGT